MFVFIFIIVCFLFGFGRYFWLVGFSSPLYFPLYGLQTFVSIFLGGHFVGGVGDLSFGSLGRGP